MATSFISVSSVFPCSSKTIKHFPSLTPSPSLHYFKRPLSVASLRSPENSQPPALPPAVETFWNWLKAEGVVSAKTPVKPGYVPELGLGLVALRDIAQGEAVVEVPRRLWINPDAVADSEIGSVCDGLKPWVSVALFLIREKLRDDTPWRAYLDILPDCTDSTLYWSKEELSELQGTQLLGTTLSVKEYVLGEFVKVEEEIILPHKDLFPDRITSDEFMWAFGMIRSRAFSRLRKQNLVMMPLVDLINHSSSVTTQDNAVEINGPAGLFSWDLLFSLRAPSFVKAGEQVFIQYDLNKSNAQLAMDYGFIELDSDRHAYTITLEISKSDPLLGDKLIIAESQGLSDTAHFDIFLGPSLPPKMLPYLRLVALRDSDAFLLEPIFTKSIWSHLENPVSQANEKIVCQIVRDACNSALSNYHTTIEEDEMLMGRGNVQGRLKMAIGIRAGEKRVLQQLDQFFKEREGKLHEMEDYHDRQLKELGLVGEEGEIICSSTK